MLVFSRHRNEGVFIGDDIEVVVANIGRSKVRLGIAAPKNVLVHRREIREVLVRFNRVPGGRDGCYIVRVLEICKDTVWIGIDGPKDRGVLRREDLEALRCNVAAKQGQAKPSPLVRGPLLVLGRRRNEEIIIGPRA